MIVPMKKVHILFTQTSDLSSICSLGILHVSEHQREEISTAVNEHEIELMRFNRAIRTLENVPARKKNKQSFSIERARQYRKQITRILERKHDIQKRLSAIMEEQEHRKLWGELGLEDIQYMSQEGVHTRFYEVPKKHFKSEAFDNHVIINKRHGMVRLMAMELLPNDFPSEYTALTLPTHSLLELEAESNALRDEYNNLKKSLGGLSLHLPLLRAAVRYCKDQIAFFNAGKCTQHAEDLHWITGYIPRDSVAKLKEQANINGWGLMMSDPEEDELPPTLVRVPKLVKIVRPIFEMFGTFPGYREFDISSYFLLFFTIFFTLIVADAGYATVLLVITVFLIIRSAIRSGSVPLLLPLAIILSVGALVWGAVTANYFGYLPTFPIFQRFVVPIISVWNTESNEFIQFLSISIGTVHIGIAYLWRFIRTLGSKHKLTALAEFGWLLALTGFYFIILAIVVNPIKYPTPDYAWNLIFIGSGLVVLFGQQSGQFFKGILKGFAQSFFTAFANIAMFSDIISYIRLYAVGLATFAVARSFNQLAAAVMNDGEITSYIIAGLILFLGHGLNIGMWALSVIVHGVRLNMLEFSNHLGVEWSGYKYSPLKESIKEGVQV